MSVTPAGPELAETEEFADHLAADSTKIAGRTPWQLARARVRRDRTTMIAFVILCVAVLTALVAPVLSKFGILQPYTQHQDLVGGLGSNPTGSFGGVSASHWLGVVPQTGWDLLSRLILGITLSLLIATSATVLSLVLGTIAGLISGFLGKWPDFWISRTMDLVLAFPQLLMLLALSSVIIDRITSLGVPAGNPSHIVYLILVLGFFGWPYFARIIRGQVLSLREREFIEAAKSIGASNRRIYFKELLPNLWAPILIYFTLNLPTNISAEAALSYLGVGVQSPTPTLGSVLTDASTYASSDPTFFLAPGITIFILVISFNLFGDGLRDALDPKSNR
ncbi:MAG: peptide transporter permease [Frankiales bacterium]|nr:peptide transporter permease [Frankiales bacterium]